MNKSCAGPKNEIIKLIDSGFFDEFKTVQEVKLELIRNGHKKFCKNVEVVLLRLVGQNLERKRHLFNGKKSWVYKKINPASMSQNETEFIFDKGSKYDFYAELKKIIMTAKKELTIVDSYIDEDIFDLYVNKLSNNIKITILTNQNPPKPTFYKISRKFKSQHSLFEVRENSDCHDRIVFVDSSAWVFGQSIKAAGNKPTYLINVKKSSELKKIFDKLWNNSKKTV